MLWAKMAPDAIVAAFTNAVIDGDLQILTTLNVHQARKARISKSPGAPPSIATSRKSL